MRIADWEVRRAAVMGFGRTGHAVTRFLLSQDVIPFVSDSAQLTNSDHAFLATAGIPYEEAGHTKEGLVAADLIVLSPGVSPNLPVLIEAKRRKIPILSELDFAYLVGPRVPTIGVTGTNGKSTTVKLIEGLLRQNGNNAIAAGNIGIPFISIVSQENVFDTVVLEVSSFQLEQSTFFHPQIAVLLNLAPNHLDRHRTMMAYTQAKTRLFLNQTKEDIAILPSNLDRIFSQIRSRKVFFDRVVLPPFPFVRNLPPHNRLNLQAAIAACSAVSPQFDPSCLHAEQVQKALALPYRLCEEGTVGKVKVVNDSKSTNAASTIAALRSVKEPVVLILGGRHKQGGYFQLARAIAAHPVRKVVLYGEAASFLREVLNAVGYKQTVVCADLEEATAAALAAASSEDVLLFSPACASFDQFGDYLERGETFSRLIRSQPTFHPIQRRQ